MAGLSRKDVAKLVRSLEAQGAQMIPRKNGWTVRFPNGDTMGLHETASDTKSFDAMRAIVRRAGLEWVFDGKDKKAMNAATRRKHAENKELIQLWLEEHEVDPQTTEINPAEISRDLGMSSSTIYGCLHALGWTKAGYGKWQHVEQLDPGLAAMNQDAAAPEELTSVSAPATSGLDIFGLGVASEPTVDERPASGIHKLPGEDEADGDWVVVRLTKGMADLSIQGIFSTYRAAGFDVELRIRSKA